MSAAAPASPTAEKLTVDERVQLIVRNLQEVMGANDGKETIESMRERMKKGEDLSVYWGTATTGAPHIGYFVPMSKIADFLRAGCHVTILFADLHAYLDNMKSSWELLKFRTQYYEAVIKAMLSSIGVPIEKLKFVRGTEYQLTEKYTLDVYRMTSVTTERNSKKAGAEVVKQVASPLLSGLLYPLLQALDEEYLKVDMQFGGVDQRKIFTFAEETLPKLGYKKRIHLMNPMVPGLQGPKMSSSEKGSKIDLLESEESIHAKLAKAYAKPQEVADNGVLAFCKMVLFALNRDPKGLLFEREEKFGGNIAFKDYEALEKAYVAGTLYPKDLKDGVAKMINKLLAPIRAAFTDEKMQTLIKQAYPPNSESFHQSAAPDPEKEKEKDDGEEDDADADDDATRTAAASAATDKKSGDAKKGGAGGKKGGGGGAKPEGSAVLDIRVGVIVKAEKHAKEGLLQLEVNTGEAKARHVVCGGGKALVIAELKDRKVPVVTNIKKTEGLIFVVQSADGKTVELLEAPAAATPGDRVLAHGAKALAEYTAQKDDLRKELWKKIAVTAASELVFGTEKPLHVGKLGACKAKTVKNGIIA